MTIPNASELQAAFNSALPVDRDIALCAGAIDVSLREIERIINHVLFDGATASQDKIISRVTIYAKFRNTELADGIIARGIKEVIEPLGYTLAYHGIINDPDYDNRSSVYAHVKPAKAVAEEWTNYPNTAGGMMADKLEQLGVKAWFKKLFDDSM